MTERLLFVESPAQALWLVQSHAHGRAVALSAEAAQALEELEREHVPVCQLADTHAIADADEQLTLDVFALARALDTHIAARVPGPRLDGPGIFESQAYSLQYSAGAVLKRAYLMRACMDALQPSSVLAFTGPIDAWFSKDGYVRNPWIEWLVAECNARGLPLELPAGPQLRDTRPPLLRASIFGRLRGRIVDLLRGHMPRRVPAHARGASGLRLLFIDALAYDWSATAAVLRSSGGVECFVAEGAADSANEIRASFAGTIRRLGDWRARPLAAKLPVVDAQVTRATVDAVHEWFDSGAGRLEALGVNLLPGIRTHFIALAKVGPELIRGIDALAERLLEIARPHAVCFNSIGKMSDIRMAHAARRLGIPNVTYQHGFAYGIQIQAKDELTDPYNADYFLVYGQGIHARAKPAFTPRARYVPIGSARIEDMRDAARKRQRRPGARTRVLWIAETSTRNTLTAPLNEDTRRYLAQRECLEAMSASGRLEITYRPYRHSYEFEGTQRWLDGRRLPRVATNLGTRLEYLISSHDVAIVETSSPTTWIEVPALGTPMILFCDPRQTLLTAGFEADLDRAFRRCRSYADLAELCRRLADQPHAVLEELRAIDCSAFLMKYALHRGECAARAASFMNSVCRERISFDRWSDAALTQEVPCQKP